ncbi:hypothetical protein A3B45_02015 [Candidatus Daviesbacteria bacterium RIFCSPLOWO2_01_FULL_39_12]|uniref:Uncharacterized protein n=1 Tax=Candidatus Daviesbacteria bacterium RIFCSPLOWO2_01_FULL_39_12 TaxID=1797785 RepID=A0A1F5KM06_9BACT|nr:MAG: hypothetical protein A3D79_03120 [Candidatus Daviesbacteria bacterium RIFCSPHIGHO2_02_FULL_39_8]OGE41977.1 MAG: hypothetical protein A3B45_02015 [Candidatus Daviesbacteria bacterium RIFCSPLOWO2_01_FULL_39_12]
MAKSLSAVSQTLISAYDKDTFQDEEKTISVNPVAADLATWYEKFRTAMDYRDDEVILRSTIERILKRRLLFGGDGGTIAPPLIRELIWARYFPDSTVAESIVSKVSDTINLYLTFEKLLSQKTKLNKIVINEWIIHLLSAEIEHILRPNVEEDIMSNFIFKLFKDKIDIADDTKEIKDIQAFIAVRRAYANDDLALLRFHLFKQYFGSLAWENIEKISGHFPQAFSTINNHLKYPLKDRFYNFIKDQTVPFIILDDVLRKNQGKNFALTTDSDEFDMMILRSCDARYNSVRGKVRRAILRSVIFIFFTKAIFALFVEGAFEKFLYGRILWSSITINTFMPPILMMIVGLFIQTPSRENSYRIRDKIHEVLFSDEPNLSKPLVLRKKPKKTDPLLGGLFMLFWLVTFILSFGAIIVILSKLKINPLSQAVFVFFLAIVSFISYRINRTAHMYILKDKKESFRSLAFDFFFMPFIQVGRRLTAAVAQINIILFIFDFIIETPFKGIVAFLEQWFLFLRTQREKLD